MSHPVQWPTVCDCLHQVSELDLFHPLYHSATLRRLYVDIMRGVDVVATTCIRDCDKDGLLPPLWQLERVTTFLKKVRAPTLHVIWCAVVVTICCSHARQHVLFGCASPAES